MFLKLLNVATEPVLTKAVVCSSTNFLTAGFQNCFVAAAGSAVDLQKCSVATAGSAVGFQNFLAYPWGTQVAVGGMRVGVGVRIKNFKSRSFM